MPPLQQTERSGQKCEYRSAPPLFRHVLACVGPSAGARQVLEQAIQIAEATGGSLTALGVLPGRTPGGLAQDPLDWDIARRAEMNRIRRLAGAACAPGSMQTRVGCGPPAPVICEEGLRLKCDLAVLGTGANGDMPGWGLGGTSRQVAERFPGSVLLVPRQAANGAPLRQRILVPHDGSTQAEIARRIATRLALIRKAELVLVHALAPIVPLIDGPLGRDDATILVKLRESAERQARERLDQVRRLIPAGDISSRVRHLSGNDPRETLLGVLQEEQAELVVLSARGQGSNADLAIGSTADYLLSRSTSPVLLVRPGLSPSEKEVVRPQQTAPRLAEPLAGYRH